MRVSQHTAQAFSKASYLTRMTAAPGGLAGLAEPVVGSPADGQVAHVLVLPALAAFALAETINGLYKTEVIHRRGPWRSFEAVEMATLEWVDWFNTRRLLAPIGYVPPAEYEAAYYQRQHVELAEVN